MSGKSRRGFASMSREKQREIAKKGGRSAHAKGAAYQWDSDAARKAGQRGGREVSKNREHMAAIGRAGGRKRGAAMRQAALERARDYLNDREPAGAVA